MTPNKLVISARCSEKATVLIRIKMYNYVPAKHSLPLRILNYLLILSCKFTGSTCLGASSLSFNNGTFVRDSTKWCLNKAVFGAPAQGLSGEHLVWIAADRLLTMPLNAHSLPCWIIWLLLFVSLFEREQFYCWELVRNVT